MRDLIALLIIASASVSACACAAVEPHVVITQADPWVRPSLLYRCTVHATGVTDAGPWFMSVALIAGESVLAVSEIELQSPGQLAAGVTVAMVPNNNGTQVPVLRARLSDAHHHLVARSQRELGDHQALYGRATLAVAHLRATSETAALPWLLAEQASELLAPAVVATIADDQALRRIVEQLEAWRPLASNSSLPALMVGTQLLAYRDDVDTSVQPLRVTVPATPAQPPAVVVVMRPQPASVVSKSHWSPLPAAWLTAAATAGVTVIEVQAAGDGTCSGAAMRRIPLALAAGRAAGMAGIDQAQVITATDGLAAAAAWRQPVTRVAVTASSALTAWSTGPFVVVVGTGEHRSAMEDAETLAGQFIAAWSAHARGLPPCIHDVEWRASDWHGHHVVLIGSSRSNRVLSKLARQLPLDWDDRQVTYAGQTAYRSLLPKIAMILPRADEPGCSLMILDGAPAWSEVLGALPFATAGEATAVFAPGAVPGAMPGAMPGPLPSATKVPLESAHGHP